MRYLALDNPESSTVQKMTKRHITYHYSINQQQCCEYDDSKSEIFMCLDFYKTYIYIYIYIYTRGKQWQATPTNLPRMQRTRAIPVT